MDYMRKKYGLCEICGQIEPLVRDHDHATGYIRGLLCNPCNGRLGVYEQDMRRGTSAQGRAFRTWKARHMPEILLHLKKNTGVRYLHPIPVKKQDWRIKSKIDAESQKSREAYRKRVEESIDRNIHKRAPPKKPRFTGKLCGIHSGTTDHRCGAICPPCERCE